MIVCEWIQWMTEYGPISWGILVLGTMLLASLLALLYATVRLRITLWKIRTERTPT